MALPKNITEMPLALLFPGYFTLDYTGHTWKKLIRGIRSRHVSPQPKRWSYLYIRRLPDMVEHIITICLNIQAELNTENSRLFTLCTIKDLEMLKSAIRNCSLRHWYYSMRETILASCLQRPPLLYRQLQLMHSAHGLRCNIRIRK